MARIRLREPWGLVAMLVFASSWDVLGYLGHVDLALPHHAGVQIAIQAFAFCSLIVTGCWPFERIRREATSGEITATQDGTISSSRPAR